MEKLITLKKGSFVDIFGPNDEYLKLIEEYLNVSIFARGEKVKISGFKKDIIIAHDTIHEMIETISKTKSLSKNDVRKLLALTKNGSSKNHLNSSEIICKGKNGEIKAKTKGQLNYIEKVILVQHFCCSLKKTQYFQYKFHLQQNKILHQNQKTEMFQY